MITIRSAKILITIRYVTIDTAILIWIFQLRIRASDQRSPTEKTSEANIRITISRDEQPPRFTGAPYTTEISENKRVNDTVMTIRASDPDLQGRLQYEIRGVAPGSNYFYIEQNTGIIKVSKPLNTQTATTYTVSGILVILQFQQYL